MSEIILDVAEIDQFYNRALQRKLNDLFTESELPFSVIVFTVLGMIAMQIDDDKDLQELCKFMFWFRRHFVTHGLQ